MLKILCILKESTVITAGSQYVFVEKFFTAASNPEEIGRVCSHTNTDVRKQKLEGDEQEVGGVPSIFNSVFHE